MKTGPARNLAQVIAKKAPLQNKVIDHLARSLLASLVLTRGEARRQKKDGLEAWEFAHEVEDFATSLKEKLKKS